MGTRSKHKMSVLQARHLLIKHSGSRNPVSRRTNQSTADYSPEKALAELKEYIEKINAEGATEEVFAKYAHERSRAYVRRREWRQRPSHHLPHQVNSAAQDTVRRPLTL